MTMSTCKMMAKATELEKQLSEQYAPTDEDWAEVEVLKLNIGFQLG